MSCEAKEAWSFERVSRNQTFLSGRLSVCCKPLRSYTPPRAKLIGILPSEACGLQSAWRARRKQKTETHTHGFETLSHPSKQLQRTEGRQHLQAPRLSTIAHAPYGHSLSNRRNVMSFFFRSGGSARKIGRSSGALQKEAQVFARCRRRSTCCAA